MDAVQEYIILNIPVGMSGGKRLVSAFAMEHADGTGDLMETVDFSAGGVPIWTDAGPCDPRGGNPALQRALAEALREAKNT